MKKLILAAVACCALFLSGCATSVSAVVQRPAELDLNGAKTIAILPFQEENKGEITGSFFTFIFMPGRERTEKREIAEFLTDKITGSVAQSGFFDLISSSVVENSIKNNEEAPCDVYLTGHLDGYRSRIEEQRIKHEDKDGNVYYTYTYRMKVAFTLVYQIIDAQTHKVISHSSERIECQSYDVNSRGSIPGAFSVVRGEVEHAANRLLRKIQPYNEVVYLKLMKDKTKNPVMKQADTLARNRMFEQAEELFLQVYDDLGLMEAGFNAALLAQIQGKLREAESLMKKVADETRDPKAYGALSNIKAEIAKAEKLRSQLESK